jgi:hypothetical protein
MRRTREVSSPCSDSRRTLHAVLPPLGTRQSALGAQAQPPLIASVRFLPWLWPGVAWPAGVATWPCRVVLKQVFAPDRKKHSRHSPQMTSAPAHPPKSPLPKGSDEAHAHGRVPVTPDAHAAPSSTRRHRRPAEPEAEGDRTALEASDIAELYKTARKLKLQKVRRPSYVACCVLHVACCLLVACCKYLAVPRCMLHRRPWPCRARAACGAAKRC